MLSSNKRYANEILDDIECYKLVLNGNLKSFPSGFWVKPWSLQSAALITRYVLENKYGLNTREKILQEYKGKLLLESKLSGMFSGVFKNNAFDVLDNAYPDVFKPWELKNVPMGFWSKQENIVEVVKWVVETQLNNDRERVCKEFRSPLLIKLGVSNIPRIGVYKCLDMAYPNEFMPWELSVTPNNFWTEDNKVKALRWLVKTKLGDNKERIKNELNTKLLIDNGLKELVKDGLQDIVNLAYPGEFNPWEIKALPSTYWDIAENRVKAVRWLVETKLNNNMERVKAEFTYEILKDNGLYRLATHGVFNILHEAYPNKFSIKDLYGDNKSQHRNSRSQYIGREVHVYKVVSWVVKNKLNNNIELLDKNVLIENGIGELLERYSICEIKQIVYKYSKGN